MESVKSPFTRNDRGMTLVEVMLASLLFAGIFLSATSLYVSGLSLIVKQRMTDNARINSMIVLEEITRRAAISNFAVITEGGGQLNLRGDFTLAFVVRNTPDNINDDTWVSYRIMPPASGQTATTIRRAVGAVNPLSPNAPGVTVSAGDPEALPGLLVSNATFQIIDPFSDYFTGGPAVPQGQSTTVRMELMPAGADVGPLRFQTQALVGAQTTR